MPKIEFKARCQSCGIERTLFGPREINSPEQLDAVEAEIDRCGGAIAKCLECDAVEQVAMFGDGQQLEPWQDAGQYDQDNGQSAGPLPPKPV